MKPSFTWRALIVTMGFLITLAFAVQVTYLPGLGGSVVRGPFLGLLSFVGMLIGLAVMTIGLTWPTVFFPDRAPRDEASS